jgi:hypothetical protein
VVAGGAPGAVVEAGEVVGSATTAGTVVFSGGVVEADLGKGRPEAQATVAVPKTATAANNGTRRRVTPP